MMMTKISAEILGIMFMSNGDIVRLVEASLSSFQILLEQAKQLSKVTRKSGLGPTLYTDCDIANVGPRPDLPLGRYQ
jgi:hypothetical protein